MHVYNTSTQVSPPHGLYHQKSNNILANPAAKKTGSNECNHMCRDLSYNLIWGQQFFRLKENKNIYSFDTKRRALLDKFAGQFVTNAKFWCQYGVYGIDRLFFSSRKGIIVPQLTI